MLENALVRKITDPFQREKEINPIDMHVQSASIFLAFSYSKDI